MFCIEVGLILFFVGSSLMDSADMRIPVALCVAGLVLAGVGMAKGGRA